MRDLIQELKENEKPFGLMDKELQEWAIAHKDENIWHRYDKGWSTKPIWRAFCDINDTFCLKADYTEEPEVIELEIKKDKDDGCLRIRIDGFGLMFYTSAPALCPKEGYRFAGYKYADGMYRYAPVADTEKLGSTSLDEMVEGILFPTYAVYKKGV